jgi:hypothetical protein
MTHAECTQVRDLLKRANVSEDTISILQTSGELLAGLAVASDLVSESGPDSQWFKDLFIVTGMHVVLTEEGWVSPDFAGDMEILDEVNAPSAA